jgi:hypothetical protein
MFSMKHMVLEVLHLCGSLVCNCLPPSLDEEDTFLSLVGSL